MENEASILWMVLWGGIGMGYFIYGRKQRRAIPFVSGIGLMVFPTFVSDPFGLVAIGALLMLLPYFIRA
ncbi:MAG: hypothetical protein P8Y95_10760 [Gammaproteobacteria bacterium]|jgi:hypothetical protein